MNSNATCARSAWRRERSRFRCAPGAPPGLPGELARKLEAWTGERFMILISQEPGEPPLREQARDAQDTALREARAHPAVKALLDRFPGAEITAVRDLRRGRGCRMTNLRPRNRTDTR